MNLMSAAQIIKTDIDALCAACICVRLLLCEPCGQIEEEEEKHWRACNSSQKKQTK